MEVLDSVSDLPSFKSEKKEFRVVNGRIVEHHTNSYCFGNDFLLSFTYNVQCSPFCSFLEVFYCLARRCLHVHVYVIELGSDSEFCY